MALPWLTRWCSGQTCTKIDEFGFNTGSFFNSYELDGKKIGEGGFGSVFKAVHQPTGSVRAVKMISKEYAAISDFQVEAAIMRQMTHPNVIEFHEMFDDGGNIFEVMELCHGGDMMDHMSQHGPLSEREAAIFLEQVFQAVAYMHSAGVCHRDLKLENFLLKTTDPVEQNTVKLIDFGVARRYQPGTPMKTVVGSLSYQAPEMTWGYCTQACDLWSCGVMMYTCLVGFPPFHGATDFEIIKKIRAAEYSFDHVHWNSISEDAKDLIKKLLDKDPTSRCSALQALTETRSWLKKSAPNAMVPLHMSQVAGA